MATMATIKPYSIDRYFHPDHSATSQMLSDLAFALAKQGTRFTNAYAASPVCSPTRAALITGLAPARLRITQHGKDGPAFWPKAR